MRYFFQEFECDAGMRSSFGGIVAQAMFAGIPTKGTHAPGSINHIEEAMVALMDTKSVTRARAVRATLNRMNDKGQGAYVVVLHRIYGARPPGEPVEEFRELSPIVELTDIVEDARRSMVEVEGVIRGIMTEGNVEAEAGHVETFWEAAGEYQGLAKKIVKIKANGSDPAKLQTARLERDAWRDVMQLAIMQEEAGKNAVRTSVASADREITTADAVRGKLHFAGEAGTVEHDLWKAARAVFIIRARREAEALRVDAEKAFMRSGGAW